MNRTIQLNYGNRPDRSRGEALQQTWTSHYFNNRAVELHTHHSHFVVTLCGHSLCTWTLVRAMRSSCSTAACVGGPSDPWPRWRLMTWDYNRLHGSQNQLTHTLLHICRRAHTFTLWGVCVWGSERWKGNESQGCQTCQSKWHVHTRTDY